MNVKKCFLGLVALFSVTYSFAQFPGCPQVDAGPDQTLPCSQNCTNLTANVFHAGATNTYTVSSIPHAPPIAYNQAGGNPTSVNTDDVWSPTINLPFPFCYYGNTYNTCKVGSNGAIDLGPVAGGGFQPWSFTANCPSPQLNDDGDIFGALHDIDPSVNGTIQWYILGSAPCRIFAVSFRNVAHFSCTNLRTTTMIVLYETTNVIDVYVQRKDLCAGWNGGRAIVGIQNEAGTAGLAAPGRNAAPTWNVPQTQSEAWRFTPNGAPIYSVDWYDGGTYLGSGTTINVCPTGTTTYTCEVTYTRCDGLQIVETDQVTVNYDNLPAPVVNITDEQCDGADDGQVTINNAPGSGPYTVDITGPSNQTFVEPNTAGGVATFTGLPDGNYNYTVTDAGGCTYQGTFVVNPGPGCCSVSASGTDLTCNGNNSGTITANPVGQAPFTYAWTNGGGTSQSGSNLPAGTYTVTMTDALGCSDQATVTINEPAALNATANPTDVSCFGACDGQITVAGAAGGTAPYQYNINAGAFGGGSTFNNLCAGNYNLILQDNNGCQFVMAGVAITEPATLTLVEQNTVPATCGANNGELTVTAGGGTGPYQYDIGGAQQASPNFTGLASAAYNVTVTDANGCTETIVVNVGSSAGPNAFIDSQQDVPCAGGLNGSVTIGANGGTTPYQFSLNGGPNQASNTFAVPAGNHTITVTDANGCTSIVNVTIGQATALQINNVAVAASCNGVCDGQITVTANGGTPPYQYSSNNGLTFQGSNILTGLCGGPIDVVVVDDQGCQINDNVNVPEPAPVTMAPAFVEPSCHGLSDGEISFAGGGGNAPYQYSVDNGTTFSATDPVTGIAAGTYDLLIQDNNGCQTTGQVTVTEPPAFNFVFVANNPSNCGAADGSFEIVATNGLAPYQYSIDGGANWQLSNGFFGGLISGLYNLVAEDANGCQDSTFSALSDNVMTTQVDFEIGTTCFNSCDGFAIVSQQFGAPPFTYTINTGGSQGNGTFAGLCAGQHFITIEDNGLCIGIQEVNIPQPDSILVTATGTDPLCNGGADGFIDVNAGTTGGDGGPYEYSIDGVTFQAGTNFPGLTAGTYTITARDGNGCLGTFDVTLDEPTPFNVVVNATDLVCFQDNTGFVQIVAAGATPPYSYDLSGNTNATGIYPLLAANNYNVTVTDANNCTFNTNQIVNEPAQLTEVNVVTDALCNGACDGEIDITAAGGTAPYMYSADNGVVTQSGNVITGLCAGNYTVYVEDANGCIVTSAQTVNEPSTVTANIVHNPATCGNANGDLTVTANGGTPAYQYSSDNGLTFQAGNNFAALAPGNYNIVVEDANGCQYDELHTVLSEAAPQIVTVNTVDMDCFGNCIGEIDVTANGGTGALTYDIGGAGQPNGLFQNQCAGNYTITVTDANNCTATQAITINEPTQLVHGTTTTDLLCFNDNTGIVDINANGGTAPYQYSFDGGGSFGINNIADYLAAGNHDIVVEDANGCQSTSTIVLNEPAELTVTGQNSVDVTCFGLCDGSADVTVAGGTGAINYAWSGGTPAGNAVTALCAGGYMVDITDANGCATQATFNITEPPMVVITSVSATDASCNGICDGTITINSAQAVQFSVDGGATFQPANSFTGLCGAVGGQVYDIVVENANGCPQASTITITEPTAVVLDPIAPIDICYEGYGTLEAFATGGSGLYHYVWDAVDTVQYYGVSGLTTQTNFTCIAYDMNGCASNAEVGVVSVPHPPFYATVTPTTVDICPGGSVTLTGTGFDGWPGQHFYEWIEMDLDTINLGDNPFTYTPTWTSGTDSIYMVGYDECFRFDTSVVVINVLDNPTPSFTGGDGCAPFDATFVNTTQGDLTGATCVWDLGNGNTYNGCTGPTEQYLTTGCYDVTLEVTTALGCYGSTTLSQAICVHEDPVAGFYWEPAQPTILDPNITIVDNSSNAVSWQYAIQGQGTSNEQNPDVAFVDVNEETIFQICQTVTSPLGCTADTCLDVTVYENILFYVPNSFTPDGDLFNETFTPVFTAGVDPYDYHLMIFNRWGEVIFESYNFDTGWDGHYGDGGLVNSGVYIWQIEFGEKLSDKKQTHRGHVTVLK
jgi:gliding motility-associated-like protein